MSNFVETFLAGKAGRNFGLPTGLDALDRAINGIQKKTSIGLAAAPKCGKTTLTDFAFVINPYLYGLKNDFLTKIDWIYFSYEIDRINKEFKYAAFFMFYDYQIFNYVYKGTTYCMDQDYLMGRKLHKNSDGSSELIQILPDHEEKLKQIYVNRIVPMFGEYDNHGKKIRHGKIDFIEAPENPTGLRNYIMHYAARNGRILTEPFETLDENKNKITRERTVGYVPNDPEKFTIIIVDHIRKLRRERGFKMKENIDKWLEYNTEIRNLCGFTFVNVCHSNRELGNVERLKFSGEWIYPTADDVKDTGNLAEESTIMMTMFNPNDEKYNLKKHMEVDLSAFPNYRSIHITESRYTESPAHIQTNMYGGVNTFQPLIY